MRRSRPYKYKASYFSTFVPLKGSLDLNYRTLRSTPSPLRVRSKVGKLLQHQDSDRLYHRYLGIYSSVTQIWSSNLNCELYQTGVSQKIAGLLHHSVRSDWGGGSRESRGEGFTETLYFQTLLDDQFFAFRQKIFDSGCSLCSNVPALLFHGVQPLAGRDRAPVHP